MSNHDQASSAAKREQPLRPILVVEDADDAREVLQLFLESLGERVVVAADGKSGLAAAREQQPRIALIDIGLPDIEGYEVARQLRAAQGDQELVLVALTGYSTSPAVDAATAAGFDFHLAKPVDLGLLRPLLGLGDG